jgi:hypothetical protein
VEVNDGGSVVILVMPTWSTRAKSCPHLVQKSQQLSTLGQLEPAVGHQRFTGLGQDWECRPVTRLHKVQTLVEELHLQGRQEKCIFETAQVTNIWRGFMTSNHCAFMVFELQLKWLLCVLNILGPEICKPYVKEIHCYYELQVAIVTTPTEHNTPKRKQQIVCSFF